MHEVIILTLLLPWGNREREREKNRERQRERQREKPREGGGGGEINKEMNRIKVS